MHLSRTWLYRALLGLFAVAALGVGLVRYTRSVTAVERLAEVQETARLSGGYAFETEIDSIRDYEPSIANYGRESVHTQLVITGSVDESAQTSQITIRNAQGIVMQIKRAQGRTYVRQAGSDWQQSTAATATSQLNTLTYLSGVVAAEAVAGDHAGYHYTFDGGAFVEHFRRLLKADSVAGINYRDEWTAIARSAQLRALHGQGTVTVDRDGLPTTMELQLVQPADAQNGAVKSVIRTTFTNYARTGLGLRQLTNQPLRLLSKVLPVSVDQLEWALYVLGVVVALAAVVTILLRAGRLVRVPGTVLMIGILLHQPYASLRPEPTVASAAERRVEQTPTPPPLPAGFDPTRSPLDAGMPVALTGGVSVHPATNTTAATNRGRVSGRSGDTSDTSDSDGDGMTDGQERLYGSNPSRADSDNDGLTDPQEQQVGTKPTIADSDADGMNDGVETKNPTRIGSNTFYTSPLSPDTNGDGFSDSLECPLKIMDAGANCQDSDSDGMPDTLDFDDDNDAIVDRIDESPTARATTTYTEASPLPLRILGTATTPKPLTVDLQIRPTDEKLLYAQNAVYDWPSNDTEGQIERTKQTTFASSLLYNARDTNAANGDVRVSAMLEVRIPVSENTSNTGFLPVKACAATNSCPANEVAPRWLDTDKLRGYGITGGWGYGADGRRGTTEVVLTIPLSPVTDASGSNVGYSAHMYYETSTTPWASAHNYRMLWTVSMLADRCPAETPSCTASEREEYATVLQSYYSNFTLTGLTATEQNGTTAALVSEDSKSTQVTDTTKRRLWYTQLYQLFSAGFVDNATLKIRDTDANISIETLFDSTRNGSARTESNYGIPKSVSRVAVATYASHENLVNVNAGLLPTVLNDALCRAANLANGCATAPALRTACEAQTTVACRPGVMLLTDASTRRKGFTGTPTIDFSGTTPTSVRSVTGTIYKVKAGGWVPIETSDAEYELPSIIANVRAATPPASVTAAQWQTYAEALATALYWATAQTKTQAWTQAALTNASNPTYTALAATFNDTWSGQVAAIMDRWSGFIEVQIANKERMEALVDVVSVSTSSTLSAISTVVDAVERVRELNAGATTGVRIRNGAGALFVVVAAAAGFAMLIYSSLGRGGLAGSSEEAIERLKQFDLAVKIGTVMAATVFIVLETAKIAGVFLVLWITGQSTSYANMARLMATETQNVGKFAKFLKALGYLAIAVSIGLTWYVGIRSAMDAEFGWQKANAISDMAGMTMAIIFIAAIAFIPVFGQLIAAVLMLLDGIAALACNGLSDKQKRSTAAQWLCGGITGILANIFTPYKSNLVIDPDDPWSYTKQLTSDGAALESQPLGFRQGNGLRMSMSATDYIERMPFPATWMALPYFWQWNGEDERKASFNYALGNTQQEMASQISTGSQYGLWNRNTSYRDGDKTYTYTKTSSFVFVNKFVQTGINRTMRDVILSQGKKVPQQTCFMIWIVFFPLPVCFIQTHADNDATNLNESEKTVFDIMPATITEFVSLRAQDDGYTFGWSPADANPAFPVFADADNDGLAKDLERSIGGADNTYDTDSDGVADRFEVARRTKLNKADSDDDGLNDSAEIIYNTNPLAADTDGDGLTDSEEIVRMVDGRRTGGWEVVYAIVNGVPQTTWVGSDPTQADGDADGIIDFREKILGWSPYAKNSGEIMGIAGTVREGIVPTVKVDFERGTPSGFPNTGYTAGALTCDGACPTVTYPTIPFVPVSPGSFNTAVRFDGARSVLVNPGAARAFSSAFTVAAALKPNTTSIWAWSRVMMAQSGQFSIIQWFDSVQVYLSTSNGIVALLIPGALDANAWRHLAVTYDGEVVTGYIDGVEKARTRAPGALIDTDATKNSITVGALPGSNGWQGELDNLAVFAVALRPSEIRDLRSERLSTVNDLVVRPGERIVATTTLTNKLLGRSLQGYTTVAPLAAVNTVADGVTMMGAYGPNAANTQDTVFTVPGNTTGTATVASCPLGVTVVCAKFDETTRTAGVMRFLDVATYGSALQCDGICPSLRDGAWSFETNAQIRTSADAGNALGSHDFTAALWVKPEGQATVTRPLVHAASGGLRLELLNERPQFVYDGAVLTAPSALPIGSWSHLLFRMRDGIRSISVNGVPVVADRTTIRYAGGFGQLYIGASVDGRSLALAALRDLQIYQRALDDAEITAVAATCDDGLLIACAGYTGSLSDQSRHGIQQLVTWSCTGCSATAGVAGIAGSALLLASDGLRLPDGYAALLSNHDFTVSQAVQVSSASQPVFTTGAATTGGNQLRVFVDGGTATATLGGVTVTAGTVNAGAWYVFSVRQKSGVLTLSVHGLSGSTVTTTRGVATAPLLQRAQAPLQFGASGSKIDAARVYRSAVDDRTLDAVARLLLRGNSELRVNQAPVSETVDIAVDTRNKVVNPDPNFERLAGACDGALAAVCLPFIAAYPSEYASVVRGKTVTQSSNYQNAYPATNAIDNNRGTFNHTLYDNKPYWQIDLGSSQDIRSVTVFPRNDCCGERIVNAMVFLTDTDLGDSRDIAANKTATVRAYDGSQAWKMMNCNTQSACALGWAERRDVTFAAGTRARYVRIQLDATQYLHLAEVRVNNKPIDPCDDTASCPVLTEGGADFSGAKYIAIDPPTSAAAFEGSAANFTVMGWFKFKNVDGDQLILQDVGPYGTNSGLHLLVRGRKLMMAYYNNDIVGATTLTPGVWYHVAFVKDGAKRTIYLNGQVDMTQAAGGYLTDVRQLTIGRTLNATVRDFQILKTAVSAAELSRTYAAPSLNLEFPFDEPATTLQYGDVLTSGLRLVCETFCPLSGIPGRDDRGVRLDGKRVLTGDANTRTYTGFLNASASAAYTVSLWVKPQNYDAWLVGQDVRNQRLRIGINPNGQATFERARECFRAYCWSQTPLVTTAKLPLGVWSHVAVSVNGNSEAVYLNGVLDATRTATDWSPPITAVSGLTAPTTNGVAPAIQTNWYGSSDPVATVEGWAFAPTNRTVRVRDGGVLDGAEGFTIMASVYPDVPDTTTMNDFFIVTREQNYTLKIHNNRLYYAVGVWSSGAGSTWRWIDSELMVNRRTWNKIAITYDKNKAGTQQIMVQVNDQRKYYQGLNAMSSSAPTTDLEIGRRQSDGAVAFVGKIDDVLIVPRGLSNAEVTALQSTSSPSDDAFAAIPNLVAYGNVAPLAPVNYGAEFIGELDGLRVSPFSLGSDAIAAQIKEAPSWNLTFEDTISTQRTTVTNGVTATVTIDSAALPDPVPSRSGIDRFLYAATCTNTGITGVECPTGNIIGMNGIAEGFDGRTTLLEVGRPKTLLDEIAAAGTIQLTVQPDSGVNARQILVQYGEAAGANTDPAFEISLTADQKVRIKIGATVFTAGTALTPAWNHIAFSYSSSSFVYIQNGVIDPTSSAVAGATFTTSNTGRLFIGGGVANTARASLFRGEIDDISFTPSVLPARKAYRLARAQFSGTVAKTTVGSVTIDADAPVVTIRTPAYVARLPRQILIQTSDKTTQVTGATYRTSLTNSTNAVAVDTTAPLCLDAVAADSFCPTFRVPEGAAATVEGRYTIHAAAYDTARNLGSAETTVLVDATAGSLALQRPTKPYTTTAEPGSSLRLLTLKIAATDPTLSNSSNAPGSGIVDVSVTVKDLSGHTLTLAPVPAVQKSDYWYATVPLPFGNPTGFYQVYGNATDAVGNTVSDVPLAVANGGVNGPIEVDTTAPHDVITYPDPDSANDYLVAHAPMTGRVSDINDGRAAIQRGLRVRLDFEAPDGAHAFDNRADSRYTTDCVACPVIAKDTVDATRRVARVNIDGTLQSLTIHNAATVLSGTFSVALMAKIADTGTLVASGIAANPRLRIHVDKVGGGFRLNARRGSVVLSSAPTLAPGKWYHILYSETGTTMSLAYGESLGAMTTASKPFAARTAFVLQPNLTLGAMQSARGATAMEDYFRGYLDDVLMSAFVLNPDDLLGAAIGAGSGTRMHQTRLAIVDDGTTNPDTLGRRARYYAPLNNTKLPVIDAVAGAMGSFCAAGVSLRTLTCPSIGDGYSTRALDLTRATDGTELGYRITTASDAAVTTGVRFRRNESATSGVFYSIQSTTQASLCAQYSYAAEKNTLVIALKCGDQASVAVPIDDTRWHTVTMTSQWLDSAQETISFEVDGVPVLSTNVLGHWNAAGIAVGAVTHRAFGEPPGAAPAAASGVSVDDIAVFDGVLDAAERGMYTFGYQMVYHETLDDLAAGPGWNSLDSAIIPQVSTYLSTDSSLKTIPGVVGDGAVRFDGNDQILHRDDLGGTFAPHNTPWSIALWYNPTTTSQNAILVQGDAAGYTYTLRLNSGVPTFAMAGYQLRPVAQPSAGLHHLVVSSDGAKATMYLDGVAVAETATSSGATAYPSDKTTNYALTGRGALGTVSSLASGTGAALVDGNPATTVTTRTSNAPWVEVDLGTSRTIQRLVLQKDPTFTALRDFGVYVLPTAMPSDSTAAQLAARAVWSYRRADTFGGRLVLDLPAQVAGRYVRVVANGAATAISLSELAVLSVPTVTVGRDFAGTIDDIRIYRRALGAADLTRLLAMTWRSSTLSERIDGYAWSVPQVENIEANVALQSVTTDHNDNSQVSVGEKTLWTGSIDTLAPRVEQSLTDFGIYNVKISDHNLDFVTLATPCGARADGVSLPAASLWARTHESALDGTIQSLPEYEGRCVVPTIPEVVRDVTIPISATSVLEYGEVYAYGGGVNSVDTYNPETPARVKTATTAVPGTVRSLILNSSRTMLYALSTTSGSATLTTFDVSRNPRKPAKLGDLKLIPDAGGSFVDMTLTTDSDGDAFVVVLDDATTQTLTVVNVRNPQMPTEVSSYVLGSPTYSLAAQNDIVAVAQGRTGVAVVRVSSTGIIAPEITYATTGYVHAVDIVENTLIVTDDDEPYAADASAPNTLRFFPLVTRVDGGVAQIVASLSEAYTYVVTTPLPDEDFAAYRVMAIRPYQPGEILVLARNSDTPTQGRLLTLDLSLGQPRIHTDTRIELAGARDVATNRYTVLALAGAAAATSMTTYRVSDRALSTRVCDRANNCTTQPGVATSLVDLGANPPATTYVRLANPQLVYPSGTQYFTINAQSRSSTISSVALRVDGVLQTPFVPTTPSAVFEYTYELTLSPGTHTIQVLAQETAGLAFVGQLLRIVVDAAPPTVVIPDIVIGPEKVINDFIVFTAVITDESAIDAAELVHATTNANVPIVLTKTLTGALLKAVYNRSAADGLTLPFTARITDHAGRTTVAPLTLAVDNNPPAVNGLVINGRIGGVVKPLTQSDVVSNTVAPDVAVAWSSIIDATTIREAVVDYRLTTITGTTVLSTTVPSGAARLPAGRTPALPFVEASAIQSALRVTDRLGNTTQYALPQVYLDAPRTPDYTIIDPSQPIYRGFLANGCAALGTDTRPVKGPQSFAFTWDSTAVRMNWQGANWDIDGELFVYLDSSAGGTVDAYRPAHMTQTITDSVALGESYVTLPVNFAGRVVAAPSIMAYLSGFQRALRSAQRGERSSVIQGADYVLHIKDGAHASLLRWDTNSWVNTNVTPQVVMSTENGVVHTDIRLLRSSIGSPGSGPVGVLAYATEEGKQTIWSTFPTTNPLTVVDSRSTIALTPLLNGYGWSSLNPGVCPRTSVQNPDSTQISASLRSTPGGYTKRAIGDSFANTEPEALAAIITQTAPLCAVVASDPWCVTVSQFTNSPAAGTSLVEGLQNELITQQIANVGPNTVVDYTFTVKNTAPSASRTMYALVQTYGGIWLTDPDTSASLPMSIQSGGVYDYHGVAEAGQRDYLLVKILPIPAGKSQEIVLHAVVDPDKAQANATDRAATRSFAKVEIRITDAATASGITVARSLEWLNAALRVDASPPAMIIPDIESIGTGARMTRIGGSLRDDSAVRLVQLEYGTGSSLTAAIPRRTSVDCGTATAGRWACSFRAPLGQKLYYRVRATDAYGQKSAWTVWYSAVPDSGAPSFAFDAKTQAAIDARAVSGDRISLSGTVSDAASLASVTVCDDSVRSCATSTSPATDATIETHQQEFTTPVVVRAKPCSTTDMTSYTQYALPMRYNEVSRVQTMQVAVTAESARSDQLDLVLRSPSGTFVPLLTTARSASTNLRATFSDGVALATTAMRSTAALTDTHELVRPDGVLSTIAGEPVAGQWTLYACDRVDDANEVTITAVALQVTTAVQATADQRPWSFELQGTAGQDNQRRNLLIWAVDAVGNTSESQTIALDIDTVSPALTVDQLATELLPGNPTVLFSGEVSDGSAVTSLVADIYTSAGFLQSVNLTPPADPPTGLREAYLFGRSSRAFRWTMPYTAIGLAAGTYTVQFAAVDSLGNRTQTDGYPFTIDAMTVPSSSVAVRQQAPIDQLQLRYAVDTGRDITEVYTTIGDDLHTTTAITDTAMTVYGLSGSRDDTLQVTMTNVISDTALKQVVVDDHALVGLTTDGYVVAQSVGTSTGFDLTTTISRTVQIALAGDDHLLTLSDTGVISDHSATGVSTFVTAAPAAAIAASRTHALAVLTNGDTIAWGMNTHGETTIPAAAQTDVAYLGAGDGFSVALTERGSVVAWGDNTLGQTTLPISATTGITSIAVGRAHAVALTVDGEVVAWGADNATQSTVPISATHAIAVFAGADSSAALTRDGTLITWGAQRQPADCCVGTAVVAFNRTHAFVHTRETRATQSVILPAGTQPRQQVATFYGVIPGRRYRYSITVRNSRGSSTVTGYVQAAVLYNKLFLPMVQPGAVVPTGAGR